MRILQVNKFFFPEYGTEKYLFDLMPALESHGHEIVHFSMTHPKNRPSKYARYFVSNVNFAKTRPSWRALVQWCRMIYSLEARKKFGELLDATKPDIVHVHSIHHQLSPSILVEARLRNIPVVQTLHDHKLVCPSYHFPMRQDQVCTDCRRGRWMHILAHRAHKKSFMATLAVVVESGLHSLTRIYERTVDCFIAPSKDMAQRLVEMGINPKSLVVVPHHVDLSKWQSSPVAGQGILSAGRLSSERGLDHIIEVAAALPDQTIYVAGDGPEKVAFEAKIRMRGLSNVKLLGRVDGEQLRQLYRFCRLVFYPTQTLETFGLTVLEAMASGKPVVATRLGAVQELITEGKTGFMYAPHKIQEGIAAIKQLLRDDILTETFGRAARKVAEQYSLETNYMRVLEVYRKVLISKQRAEVGKIYSPEPLQA